MRLWVFLIFIALGQGCKASELAKIKDEISGPFSLASFKNLVYVLNSSFAGDFEDGSVQRYELSLDGKLSLSQTVSLPRLGTELAVSPTGDLIAVSILGDKSQLLFLEMDEMGKIIPDKKFSFFLENRGAPKKLKMFTLAAYPDRLFMHATIDPRGTFSRVIILEIDKKLGLVKELLRFPEVVYPPGTPYFVSMAAVHVDENAGRIYTFPKYVSGRDSQVYFPDVRKFLTGEQVTPSGVQDFKVVSAWQTDFGAILGGQAVLDSVSFAPLAFNDFGQIPEPYPAPDSGDLNPRWRIPSGFMSGVPSDECLKQVNSDVFPIFKGSSMFVENREVDGYYLDTSVYAFTGFDRLKNFGDELKSLPLSNRVIKESFGRILSVKSVFTEPKNLASATTLSDLFFVPTPKGCLPLGLRVEFRSGGIGLEKSWFVYLSGQKPNQTEFFELPGKGNQAFTYAGNFLISASYSENTINIFKFDGQAISQIQ